MICQEDGILSNTNKEKLLDTCLKDEEFQKVYNTLPQVKQQILRGEIERYLGSAQKRTEINLDRCCDLLIKKKYIMIKGSGKMNDDFSALRNMKYSGRGIMIGLTLDEKPFIGYSLTGRSPPSQARKLEYDPNQKIISTQVTDKEQLAKGNAALLIYQAVAFVGNGLMIASNGRQTRLLMDAFYSGERSPIHILTKANEIPIIEEIPGIDGKIEK